MYSVVLSDSEVRGNNLPCEYSFHVWYPDEDIRQKVKDVSYKVSNITGYIDREFLTMKATALEELKQCQNWTIHLERQITELKFKTLKGRIIERDTSNSITDVERDLLDLKKKVSHLKNNYQRMHRSFQALNSGHMRKAEPISHREINMLDLLKDTVRDLKAEWVVVKRDVIDLQTEHRSIKMGQNKYSNSSFHISESIQLLTSKLSTLEVKNENLTNVLKSQSDKNDNLNGSIQELNDHNEEYTVTADNIKNDLRNLEANVKSVDKDLGLLKDDNAYLKTLVIASLKSTEVNHDRTKENKRRVITSIPKDCQDVSEMGYDVSGVYQIKPEGAEEPDNIYCEFLNGTAYTVIQRRTDGLLSFNRQWIEYKFGFGNLYGSHWIGNEWINFLTNQDEYTLRIDIWDWEGKKHFSEYRIFSIGSQDVDYQIHVGGYTGNAGDSLSFHDGMKFSTEDMDNDLNVRHCAAENKSGWWFNNCYLSNLNGVYHVGFYSHSQYSDGIVWFTLKENDKYSLRKVEMKLRRNTN